MIVDKRRDIKVNGRSSGVFRGANRYRSNYDH